MAVIRLRRLFEKERATIGMLSFVDGLELRTECFTLEDARSLVEKGCIPTGAYELHLRPFGGVYERYRKRYEFNAPGMLWLQNVHGFEDVLIHCGNTDKDTRGCILVGDSANAHRGELVQSLDAYRRVYTRALELIKADRVTLEVICVTTN